MDENVRRMNIYILYCCQKLIHKGENFWHIFCAGSGAWKFMPVNPSTQQTEVRGELQVLGQPGLHKKTCLKTYKDTHVGP